MRIPESPLTIARQKNVAFLEGKRRRPSHGYEENRGRLLSSATAACGKVFSRDALSDFAFGLAASRRRYCVPEEIDCADRGVWRKRKRLFASEYLASLAEKTRDAVDRSWHYVAIIRGRRGVIA